MPVCPTATEVVSYIQSGQRLYIQGAAATPTLLTEALSQAGNRLSGIRIHHLHTEGSTAYALPHQAEHFQVGAFFVGSNLREAVRKGYADYIPVFLSEIPQLFRRGVLTPDVVMIHVSPPDAHGFCSLGTSVEATLAALEMAPVVLAQVNQQMPRVHGDGQIHISRFTAWMNCDLPIPEHLSGEPHAIEIAIGQHIAERVDDGATLQMGIGSIPNAVLGCLMNHKNLGVHTEMFSDGLLPLVQAGVVNNRLKKIHPHKIVSTFVMGSRNLYDFLHDNPSVMLLDVAYVNDTAVIRQNQKVTAINSAIEVDLTGQICADSMGEQIFSGVGGQMDFIRGASLSEGGRPIIALPAQTRSGISRIVPHLRTGSGVVTTRAHVHEIVTEYGVANLYGKSLRQRAAALIEIAHPNHREMLERAAFDRFGSSGVGFY
ncbi:MAG: acetyl-CoA hydrolase/transferase family protein [Bacteroidetes bacterium]|nr:acetyl-CoA hydrolase/transferase family protein [Bacteroidota bacterium]